MKEDRFVANVCVKLMDTGLPKNTLPMVLRFARLFLVLCVKVTLWSSTWTIKLTELLNNQGWTPEYTSTGHITLRRTEISRTSAGKGKA